MQPSDFPDYDAGLLNDYGGGDTSWWMDYLRAEIGRANEHWRAEIARLNDSAALYVRTLVDELTTAQTEAGEAILRAEAAEVRATRAEAALATARADALEEAAKIVGQSAYNGPWPQTITEVVLAIRALATTETPG